MAAEVPQPPLPPPLPPPVPVRLTTLPDRPCPYLPGRVATSRAFLAGEMGGAVYDAFMDAGFRRSGTLVYQPVCRACRACVPVRVVVDAFAPTRSQRRCATRNADLTVEVAPPVPTDETFDLYARYQTARHADPVHDDGEEDEPTRAAFESFLYESPVDTLEFTYRDPAGRVLAVGIADFCPRSLSSVYFYYDPAESARGLGTYGAIREIDWCRTRGVPYYHLGFWVAGCRKLEYKRRFGPNELLRPDGQWGEARAGSVE